MTIPNTTTNTTSTTNTTTTTTINTTTTDTTSSCLNFQASSIQIQTWYCGVSGGGVDGGGGCGVGTGGVGDGGGELFILGLELKFQIWFRLE